MRMKPFGQAAYLCLSQAQAELGAPPQDVVGRHRPFVAHEVLDLALVEAGAEMQAEIIGARCAGQDVARDGAVGPRQPLRRGGAEPRIFRFEIADQRVAPVPREVAARQSRAARPRRSRPGNAV